MTTCAGLLKEEIERSKKRRFKGEGNSFGGFAVRNNLKQSNIIERASSNRPMKLEEADTGMNHFHCSMIRNAVLMTRIYCLRLM